MSIPLLPAAKLALIQELMHPPIYDEHDNIIGYGEPLISEEEVRKLLGLPPIHPHSKQHPGPLLRGPNDPFFKE